MAGGDMAMNSFKRHMWLVLIAYCIVGLIYPPIGIVAVACMLAPVVTGPFMGRKWCNSFCPRGSFNDVMLKRVTLNKGIPRLFKATAFKVIFLIVLMSLFAMQLTLAWGDWGAVGLVFVRMVLITTIIDIMLGIYYHQRTWCAFCPMGTMGGWAFKLKNRIKRRLQGRESLATMLRKEG